MARRRSSGGKARTQPSWSAREVVELAVQHNLAELEVEGGGVRIKVIREHAPAEVQPARRAGLGPVQASQPVAAELLATPSNLVTIEAPMVGTFYRASAPDALPLVSEGDIVKEGQVLCIIEAMKLMNEIEARLAGRIAKVLVENAQPVEYGQPLFLVEPRA